jgi:hypothetical protein
MEFVIRDRPFPHLLATRVLSADGEIALRSALAALQWTDHSKGYYRFQIAVDAAQLARLAALPAVNVMIEEIRTVLVDQLKLGLSREATLAAHRYDEHSIIGFHTDFSAEPDVRFVLNINDSWSTSNRGIWILSSRPDISEAALLPPLSNTGFAFATGRDSYHALSRRSGGQCYAVVASYPVLGDGTQ